MFRKSVVCVSLRSNEPSLFGLFRIWKPRGFVLLKKIGLALGVFVAVSGASAANATTVFAYLESAFVGPNASVEQRIDFSSYLQDYRITGASLFVYLSDDYDEPQVTTSEWSAVSSVRLTRDASYTERTRTIRSETARETAALSLDGVEVDRGMSLGVQRTTSPYTPYSCTTRRDGFRDCFRSRDIFQTTTYTIQATLLANFGGPALDPLNTNGFLDFTVSALEGDFNIRGGTLALRLEALPPSTVPLPASMVLLLSSLGLAGAAARNRQRRAV